MESGNSPVGIVRTTRTQNLENGVLLQELRYGRISQITILKRPRGILLITSRLHGADCAPGALGESEKLSGTSLVGGNPLEPFVEAFPLVGAEAETGRKGTLQCAFVVVQVVNYRPPTLSKTGHFSPLAAPTARGSGVSLGKVSLDNAGHHAKTLAGLLRKYGGST